MNSLITAARRLLARLRTSKSQRQLIADQALQLHELHERVYRQAETIRRYRAVIEDLERDAMRWRVWNEANPCLQFMEKVADSAIERRGMIGNWMFDDEPTA